MIEYTIPRVHKIIAAAMETLLCRIVVRLLVLSGFNGGSEVEVEQGFR
ncbi:MAG: hypothetical protein FCKEOINB_00509 [Nitrosomonas sp.]|nr:hypothetical protein [Nitrosomonas sp.]